MKKAELMYITQEEGEIISASLLYYILKSPTEEDAKKAVELRERFKILIKELKGEILL